MMWPRFCGQHARLVHWTLVSALWCPAGSVQVYTKVRERQRSASGTFGGSREIGLDVGPCPVAGGIVALPNGAPHLATTMTHCQIYRLSHDALAPLLLDNTALMSTFDRSVRRVTAILHREVASATEAID